MLPADWWRTIHERIQRGDPTATAELAENAVDLLCSHLKCRFPTMRDRDCIDDAATEALVSYIKRPDRYDPRQKRLLGYLKMAAEADLRNILAKEKRRKEHEPRDYSVELGKIAGKEPIDVDDGQSRQVTDTLAELFKDPIDRELAALVIDGERSTEKFAALLGIIHLPAPEQRKTVKRHKDRIKKIYSTAAGGIAMTKSPLQRFAERARKDPFFLAGTLIAYQQSRGWDDQSLAAFLECEVSALHRLAACRTPSAAPPTFQDEVRAIAAFAGCSPEKLAIILREVMVVTTMRSEGETSEQTYLMAARDRKSGRETDTGKKHGPKSDKQ